MTHLAMIEEFVNALEDITIYDVGSIRDVLRELFGQE